MIIVVMLIAISLIIALIFLAMFLWNFKAGQYEDTYTPSVRILFDDLITKAAQASEGPSEKETKN